MRLRDLSLVILDLNAALDSENFDDYTMEEAKDQVEKMSVFEDLWARGFNQPSFDEAVIPELEQEWNDIWSAFAGDERRKWGVKNGGLCLLIAWTGEILQVGAWEGRWK